MVDIKQVKQTLDNDYTHQIIKNSLDLITILDESGVVVFDSPSVEKILGYSPGELVGKNAFDLVHPEDMEKARSIFAELVRTPRGTASAEFRCRHKDGSWRILDSIGRNLLGESPGGILINSRDRTERKAIEKELVQKKEQLLEAQQLAHLGSWKWNIEKNEVSWSDEMRHILGLESGKGPVSYESFLEMVHPQDREIMRKQMSHSVESRSGFSFEYRIIRPGGDVRMILANGNVMLGNGGVVGVRGTGQDITEMKNIEKELRLSKLELEQRVLERTKEISEVNEKLIRSLHEKELLLNEIHHRVKNNLQIISSLVKLQMKQSQNTQETVAAIQSRLKAIALVHEMLYESKDMSRIDFRKYVHDLFNFIIRSLLYNTKQITLKVDIGQIYLDIDNATNLGLILNELIANAIKHGFSGGKSGVISVSMRKNGDYVMKVSNTGLPGANIDLQNPKSMGLTLVCSLVEQLDGSIELNSEKNTEFIIKFPSKEKWKMPEY